ncbi:MAG: hypothetical protein U0354_20360 [Candidatus Sericytochromatia bacterium]
MATTKSMNISFSIQIYEKLSEISKEQNTTVTELVRNTVIQFLKEEEKNRVIKAIEEFALEFGGTEFDLDTELEEASEYNKSPYELGKDLFGKRGSGKGKLSKYYKNLLRNL